MSERRSLRFPITLGVTMIVVIVAMIIGWIGLTVFNAMRDPPQSSLHWALLTVGTGFLAFVLVGVVMYLILSIKAINLNRRQSNFIDSVTHELKTPVASLKLYLQTINRRQITDQERAQFNEIMMDDVERLDRLINHMLEAAAIDKPKDDSELIDIDLADLLRDVAKSVCTRYRVDPNIIQLDLFPFMIRARHSDSEMIFRNLIDNAVKYSGSPPVVKVIMRIHEDLAIVLIEDNGPGIPAELRRKVFGRFVRLGKELEREKPGTGLGLYIVRTLVRKLGGKVRIVDRASKTGTVFEVQLTGRCLRVENGQDSVAIAESNRAELKLPSNI